MNCHRLRFAFLTCFTLFVVAPNNVASASALRTVALSGQQAPGTSGGVSFDYFFRPVLNGAGETAFVAELTGSGVGGSNSLGIWSEGSGSLELVARSGSQAAGAPIGERYGLLVTPVLNAAGQVAFRASLIGRNIDQTNQYGIWWGDSDNLRLVARQGSQAAGAPSGINYRDLGFPVLNSAGQIAFGGGLTGDEAMLNDAVWSGEFDNLELVARRGDEAPGTPTGSSFRDLFVVDRLNFNDAGETTFSATAGPPQASGVWLHSQGGLEPIAVSGAQVPGMPEGVTFDIVGFFGRNNAGHTAINVRMTGPGIEPANADAIWSDRFGSPSIIVRGGDQAPGTDEGQVFSDLDRFGTRLVMNGSGRVAFEAELTGPGVDLFNNTGFWSDGTGVLQLVAREGGHAPGTPDGVVFGPFLTGPAGPSVFESLVLNRAGQVAFLTRLDGDGVDFSNDMGIWASDRHGVLQLVAREGDPLQVAAGDFRMILSLEFLASSGNEGGRHSGFNDRGQLAFMASFTDGSSGIFISNLVAVPEPATLMLALTAFVLGSFGRFTRCASW